MPDDTLFRQLCRLETLKLGWHLAHLDSRDDFVLDAVGYEDFAFQLPQRLSHLGVEVSNRRYRPRYLTEVEIPKDGLSVRPGNVLPIEEAVILNAITYLLAPQLDSELKKEVHSYRLHKNWQKRVRRGKSLFKTGDKEIPFLKNRTIRKFSPFTSWYEAWPEFDRVRVEAALKKGFNFLTRTDIASYFENIDLSLLEVQLRSYLPKQTAIVELLMRILHTWTRDTSTGTTIGRGIPQGNDVSSFLANIYLIPLDNTLDQFCRRHDAVWFRYVDDVEVYSRNYSSARDVVLEINESLRSLHLNLQGSKTAILSGRKLKQSLSTTDMDKINAAMAELQNININSPLNQRMITSVLSELSPIADQFRSGLPHSARNLTKSDSRILRRLMTVYGMSGRPYLKSVALSALKEPPELRMLQKSLRYLQQLPNKHHEEIANELLSLVENSTFTLPYHTASVIEALRWLHPMNAGKLLAGRIVRATLRTKSDWLIRQKAAEVLLSLPYREDHVFSHARNLLNDDHPFVRRAAALLITRGPVQDVRETVASLVYHPDPSLNRLALMWAFLLKDKQGAITKIHDLRSGLLTSKGFVLKIPQLWLIRCCTDETVISNLRTELQRVSRKQSNKVCWHVDQLLNRTEWVESTS